MTYQTSGCPIRACPVFDTGSGMTSLRVYNMEDFERFYNIALRFLAYRPRSEEEIRKYLLKKTAKKNFLRHSRLDRESDPRFREDDTIGIEDDTIGIIEKVIAKLKEQKFINDEEFVKWWIEQRSAFKTKSIRFIKMELQQKGVDINVTDRIIHNSEFIIQNDLERAKKLIEKRIERVRNLSRQEIYRKLGSYLARRGFDWETIKKSIDYVQSHERS